MVKGYRACGEGGVREGGLGGPRLEVDGGMVALKAVAGLRARGGTRGKGCCAMLHDNAATLQGRGQREEGCARGGTR